MSTNRSLASNAAPVDAGIVAEGGGLDPDLAVAIDQGLAARDVAHLRDPGIAERLGDAAADDDDLGPRTLIRPPSPSPR